MFGRKESEKVKGAQSAKPEESGIEPSALFQSTFPLSLNRDKLPLRVKQALC